MARESGILDRVLVLDSGGSDITTDLGHIIGAGFGIDNQTYKGASLNNGAGYVDIFDKMAIISCDLAVNPIDFRALKLIGGITTQQDGSWTWAWAETLPTLTMKGNIHGSNNYATLTGVKFGDVSIKLSYGNPVEISFKGYAKDITKSSGSLTASVPSTARMNYLDGYVADGSDNEFAKLQNMTIELKRGLEVRGGIEKWVANSKRKPGDIIEKLKDITFSGTADITDDSLFTKVMGGDSIADSRTDLTLKLAFSTTQGTLVLSGARISSLNHSKSADGEVRTVDFNGTALDISASGGGGA